MVVTADIEKVTSVLEMVKDPEIPVLSITDMGIIRNVEMKGDRPSITITPTYSGCPAMDVIEEDITIMLKLHGIEDFELKTEISPAWTTDWMTDEGKRKLREFGIAPPEGSSKSALLGHDPVVTCPLCGSKETTVVSEFGSTACKAQYRCTDCLEPFDYFKCV